MYIHTVRCHKHAHVQDLVILQLGSDFIHGFVASLVAQHVDWRKEEEEEEEEERRGVDEGHCIVLAVVQLTGLIKC